ncbi:filamentation induced by cAMP protein Fic [Desulfofarcimen acetoxidans DSM 771]|uniref:Filamentation induced by cAMP protein Fic n=1 Tax=Desulfofarcimen acetoxidans (strain ATCC 49208 / DSM 771 / KCTC 5769 / VKM B-1644 / 5575) TaxID=485916 RepID=C8VY56_DESAS|nr:Fic family protein [Desulfofarcimen acetoxidans]ACV64685.1 filamentation induced by cAMP protein Fic [Desulfofarcimen acetoxidans DSM 771]
MRKFDYHAIDSELYKPDIVNLLSAIHEYKGKQELFIEVQPDILEAMLKVAKIQSTGASNRIEGIYTSEARLHELVIEEAVPRNRDEQEIAGYREVLNTIHENYEYIPPTPNIILQLHRDLYTYSPASVGGRYKNTDNVIEEVDNEGNRRTRFQPLPAYATVDAMEALSKEFLKAIDRSDIDPLILIAKFILDFLCIHPFNDGNGRMSRLLTLLLLYQQGYIVGKYISIEMIIENTKESYYEALELSSKGWHDGKSNYAPFVKYYLGVILSAYKEFASRVETIRNKGLTKSERIRHIFSNKVGKITKAEIATLCPDVSITTIEKALSDLLKEEYIIKIGAGRSTAYIRNHESRE